MPIEEEELTLLDEEEKCSLTISPKPPFTLAAVIDVERSTGIVASRHRRACDHIVLALLGKEERSPLRRRLLVIAVEMKRLSKARMKMFREKLLEEVLEKAETCFNTASRLVKELVSSEPPRGRIRHLVVLVAPMYSIDVLNAARQQLELYQLVRAKWRIELYSCGGRLVLEVRGSRLAGTRTNS